MDNILGITLGTILVLLLFGFYSVIEILNVSLSPIRSLLLTWNQEYLKLYKFFFAATYAGLIFTFVSTPSTFTSLFPDHWLEELKLITVILLPQAFNLLLALTLSVFARRPKIPLT